MDIENDKDKFEENKRKKKENKFDEVENVETSKKEEFKDLNKYELRNSSKSESKTSNKKVSKTSNKNEPKTLNKDESKTLKKNEYETSNKNEFKTLKKNEYETSNKNKYETSNKNEHLDSDKVVKHSEYKEVEGKKTVQILAVRDIFEWIYCIIIAVIIAVLIKYYLGTPTVVKQSSMFPTLVQNDRLILSRLDRNKKKCPERGDIITFEAPTPLEKDEEPDLENPVAKYTYEPEGWWNRFVYYVLEFGKTSYIKRVIGLPGEHVEIKDFKVYINGEELKEDYLDPELKTPITGDYCDIIVPENCVFAMGDNRIDSKDCREFGCIPIEKIEGKVVLRFFPFDKFGTTEKINSLQKEKWDEMENE